tara:strand:+ start:22377 stop:24773 length:2397 start_codon:yes stop_codon:yes gene_type:complete
MIISIDWLKEFVEVKETQKELEEMLSGLGLEAERYLDFQDCSGLVIAKIESIKKHPNADRLNICVLDSGQSKHQVVCGASNVKVNKNVVFALPGSILPRDFKIKSTKIRGIESHGMICSEKELRISDEHDGIMILPDNLPLGTDFVTSYGSKFLSLNLDITPNRPDAMSHRGVARDISSKTGRELLNIKIKKHKLIAKDSVDINIEDAKDCIRYIGGVVEGLTVGPSPNWMIDRLKACGQRSVNNIVDISNYVLLEIGHPTHIFDFEKLNSKKISIRRAHKGEKIKTLDSKSNNLDDLNLIITDGMKPIALAGIIGGENSAVSEKTSKVFIESAYFNPITIRKSAKKLQISTDASKRFERGLCPNNAELAFWRVVNLLEKYGGGKLVSNLTDMYPESVKVSKVLLRQSEIFEVLGIEITNKTISNILKSLEINFVYEKSDKSWNCELPSFRPDISREIDLIEEIARIFGYDQIPSDQNIFGTYRFEKIDPESIFENLRDAFRGMGFHQVYSNSLQSSVVSGLDSNNPSVKIINPLSKEMEYLRSSLIPGLLIASDYNLKNGSPDLRFFELANVHQKINAEKGGLKNINELKFLTGILHGNHILNSIHEEKTRENFFTLKGVLSVLFEDILKIPFNLELVKKDTAFDYQMSIVVNNLHLGEMGVISSAWIKKLNLDIKEVFAFEINLNKLLEIIPSKKDFSNIISVPKIIRDINLVMKKDQETGSIVKMMLQEGKKYLKSVIPVDIYNDHKTIGEKFKSVTFELHFQSDIITLEDKDVNPIIDDIIRIANNNFNAKLRL